MESLANVHITDVHDGDVLVYDEATDSWHNESLVLNDLADVTIDSPSEPQILSYDGTSDQWKNS